MRDYTVEFGFLPYPKYDEAQKDYISLDWGGLLSVPHSVSNPDMVGAAMELLAWESSTAVIPTYYDTVLTGKLARDDDAIKMMDILKWSEEIHFECPTCGGIIEYDDK